MQKYKLLVVDDAFFIRNLIKKSVSAKMDGYPVEVLGEAKNAKDALDFLKDEDPDILTIDYQMPPGEDGVALIKEVQTLYPNKMVLMISDDMSVRNTVKQLGCEFLMKPFKDRDLWNALDSLVEEHKRHQAIMAQQKNKEPKVVPEIEKEETLATVHEIKEEKTLDTQMVADTPKKKRKKRKKKKSVVSNIPETIPEKMMKPPVKKTISDFGFEVIGSLADTKPMESKTVEPKPIKKKTVKKIETVDIDEFEEIPKEEKEDAKVETPQMIEPIREEIKETMVKEEDPKTIVMDDDEEIIMDDDDDVIEILDEEEEEEEKEKTYDKIVHEIEKTEEEMDEIKADVSALEDKPENADEFLGEKDVEEIHEPQARKMPNMGVVTFEEEDPSAYEDPTLSNESDYSDETVSFDLDETEEPTEEEELADLIKEASYNFEDTTQTIAPTEVKKSQLETLSGEDIFVDIDDIDEEMESEPIVLDKEKMFDKMLDEFESSDQFGKNQESVEDIKTDTQMSFDLNDEPSVKEMAEFVPEETKEEMSDNFGMEFSFDYEPNHAEQASQEVMMQEPVETKKEVEDLKEKTDQDFFGLDEEFDLDELAEEEDTEIPLTTETTTEMSDFDSDGFDDLDFSFDDISENKKTSSLYNTTTSSKSKQSTVDDDLDLEKLIDDEINKDSHKDADIDIFDTNELPTMDIIKQHMKLSQHDDDGILPPNVNHLEKEDHAQFSSARPDGTEIKQKKGFFSRFFGKK